VALSFILSIYESGWSLLKANNNNRIFRQNIASKFIQKTTSNKPSKGGKSNIKDKQVEVIKIPPLILPRPSKETLEKLKFFYKKDIKPNTNANSKERKLYTQATSLNIREILKIKNIHNSRKIKNQNQHNVTIQ